MSYSCLIWLFPVVTPLIIADFSFLSPPLLRVEFFSRYPRDALVTSSQQFSLDRSSKPLMASISVLKCPLNNLNSPSSSILNFILINSKVSSNDAANLI